MNRAPDSIKQQLINWYDQLQTELTANEWPFQLTSVEPPQQKWKTINDKTAMAG